MKTIKFLSVIILTILSTSLFAQSKKDTFNVSGNCAVCKARIEKAIKIPGVTSADWNVTTKLLTVTYIPSQIELKAMQKRIAEAGHDNSEFAAKEDVYAGLPGCCQYERSKEAKASNGEHPKKQPANSGHAGHMGH